MSSFNGTINEIPSIAVDNFETSGKKFYFLSHCHTDHLKGIEQLPEGSLLYATPISSLIIRKKYPKLKINELEIGITKQFEVKEDNGNNLVFNVNALSAGHCIGACMLLFQIDGKDILYTGDFRISIDDAKKMIALREVADYGNLSLYLDSTFMLQKYAKFPKLKESIAKAIEVADKHIKSCRSHKVHIMGSARYGYERLLIEMSQFLRQKFYCFEEEIYEQYSQIAEISKYITKNDNEARIFVKPKFVDRSIPKQKNICTIHLSAMFWENWNKDKNIVMKVRDDLYRIPYATHNSFEEIRDFLLYLKPKKIYLNVLPTDIKERYEMDKLKREIQQTYMDFSDNEEMGTKLSRKFSFKRTNDTYLNENNIKNKKSKY